MARVSGLDRESQSGQRNRFLHIGLLTLCSDAGFLAWSGAGLPPCLRPLPLMYGGREAPGLSPYREWLALPRGRHAGVDLRIAPTQ